MAARVGAFDWSATPLGPMADWPQSLRTAVDIMLGSGHAMQLAWGPQRTILYNDAYAPMLGKHHPNALGLPFAEAWPDIWDQIEPLVARVFAGETQRFEDMPLVMERHGYPEDTWWNFSYSPIRDESGAVAGLLNVTVDATPKVRIDQAEAALRDSATRQTFLLALSDVLRPLGDPIAIQHAAMRALGEHLRVNRAFYGGAADDDDTLLIGPGYAHDTFPLEGQVRFSDFELDMADWYRAGQTYVIDDTQHDLRFGTETKAGFAAIAVGAALGVPLVKDGHVRAIISLHQSTPRNWTPIEIALVEDVAERTWAAVERARVETALREREGWIAAQKDALRLAIDGAPIGEALTVLSQATVDMIGHGARCAFYLVDAELDGLRLVAGMPEDYGARVDGFRIGLDSLACGLATASSAPVITPDVRDEPRWREWLPMADEFDYRAVWSFPLETAAGAPVGTLALYFAEPRDPSPHELNTASMVARTATIMVARELEATERARAEAALRTAADRQQLLLAELQHRVRNILTVIRSVFSRTVETGGDVNEMADHFRGRLDNMARMQVVVTRDPDGLVDLETMIRDELLSVAVSDGPNVTIEGPDVLLDARSAEMVGLAIHELVTNALKYGAFKAPTGRLDIRWVTNMVYGGDRRLALEWREQGVPAIELHPVRQGFGMELIREALPYRLGAETSVEFNGGGVRCTISIPLPHDAGAAGVTRDTDHGERLGG